MMRAGAKSASPHSSFCTAVVGVSAEDTPLLWTLVCPRPGEAQGLKHTAVPSIDILEYGSEGGLGVYPSRISPLNNLQESPDLACPSDAAQVE